MAIVTTKLQFSSNGEVNDTQGFISQGVLSIEKPYNNGFQYLSFETNKIKALYGNNTANIRWYVTADSTHEINAVRYKAKILSMSTYKSQNNALCCVGSTNPKSSSNRDLMGVGTNTNNKTFVVSNTGSIRTPTITGVNENNFFNNEFSIEFKRTADGTQLTITNTDLTVNFTTSWILETGVDKQLSAFWLLWGFGWLDFEIYDIEVDVEQYYPSPTINNISRDKNELTINASSSELLSDRTLSYKWCENSYNGTVISFTRKYTVTVYKQVYVTVIDSNNKVARTNFVVYIRYNHRYSFGSNRYRYWLQTGLDNNGGIYEDIIGDVNEYMSLPSNNIVDIWCNSNYRLHIYDIKKSEYYCIQHTARDTRLGTEFYINSDLDNTICAYHRSMYSLSKQFLMYSTFHTYVINTNIDPNVTDTINCYYYRNYSKDPTINEVDSYFKGLKAFQIPVSPISQVFDISSVVDTRYAETNYPKTLEIRWRFTSTNDSERMIIIDVHSSFRNYGEFYLVKDITNNRYYIQLGHFGTLYNSDLLPRNFDPTKWHTICIQGYRVTNLLCMIYIDGILVLEQHINQPIFNSNVIYFGAYGLGIPHEPIYDEVVFYDGIKYITETYRVNNDYPLIDPYYEPPQPTVNFYPTKEKVSAGEYFDLILNSNDILFTEYSLYINGIFILSDSGEFSSTTISQQLFKSGQSTYRIVFKDTNGEQREKTCNVLVEAQDFSDLFVRYVPNFNTKKVLEYKTQIFTSYNHNEERIPLRQCPRVTFEYEYDLYNHESFVGFNNSFNESGLTSIYTVPSWIDAIQVSDTSETITLPIENNFVSGSNVLVFKSFSEYEVVSCTITNNTIALNGLEDIHTDCIVVPIFNCYLVDAPKLKQQDHSHTVSVKFITAQNMYNGFKNYNTSYLGHDLLADFYTTSRELTTDVDQDVIITDYDIGLRSLYTLNDRTYNGISFNVQCLMSEYPVLQNFLKRRFGKVNPFFIPKETGDLIKRGKGIISTSLNIEMNNFDFDKRPYLFIRLKNGNHLCRKVISTSADKRILVLDSALNIKYEDIVSINTLLFVRLDSDKITYKSVGYGMYSVSLSCVEVKFEEYLTITDYDIRP